MHRPDCVTLYCAVLAADDAGDGVVETAADVPWHVRLAGVVAGEGTEQPESVGKPALVQVSGEQVVINLEEAPPMASVCDPGRGLMMVRAVASEWTL